MSKGTRTVPWCSQQLTELEMLELSCTYDQCRTCGFNYKIANFRKKQIERLGLTKCDDGLYRYIIPRRRRENAKKTT